MLRLSPLFTGALCLAFCLLSTGCKTLYSDTYSHRRNYFKAPPPKKEAIPEAEKKALASAPATGVVTPAIPEAAPAAAPAPPADAMGAPPALPGL